MEEQDTDRHCTRCGTKTQMCDECLDTYCVQCERSGECPYCGILLNAGQFSLGFSLSWRPLGRVRPCPLSLSSHALPPDALWLTK
eukprot:gene17855-biopygen23378